MFLKAVTYLHVCGTTLTTKMAATHSPPSTLSTLYTFWSHEATVNSQSKSRMSKMPEARGSSSKTTRKSIKTSMTSCCLKWETTTTSSYLQYSSNKSMDLHWWSGLLHKPSRTPQLALSSCRTTCP